MKSITIETQEELELTKDSYAGDRFAGFFEEGSNEI